MKQLCLLLVCIHFFAGCSVKSSTEKNTSGTWCNPVNISYRFCLDQPSRREAADPTVVKFKGRYYLFASKSGGYWHSEDLLNWSFVGCNEIPVEDYAPTAVAIGDTLYFLASSDRKSAIYKTTDPLGGKWSKAIDQLEIPVWDPAFFLDEDQRLYLLWGCSNKNPLYGVELNYKKNFSFIGKPKELMHANPSEYGWEVPGDYNTKKGQSPWIEGAWLNKHKGKYYLQYSGPGTEFKSYADAVYISESPLGQYTLARHNPYAYKPEGFAAGAGHGSTFEDSYGNYWHIGTSTISVKHIFERRLVLHPAFFDEDGILYTVTKFGDYPFIIPQKKISGFEDIFPGWMLLSYNKKIQVSSSLDSFPSSGMTDENIRTYWAAESGDSSEYAILDLGKPFDVYSLQINFAEHQTNIYGRQKDLYHRYTVEFSNDQNLWKPLIDKSHSLADNSHDYMQLEEKVNCRYLRLRNIHVPGGHFAVSGFRVFGKGDGEAPEMTGPLKVHRDQENRKSAKLTWTKQNMATGYNITYGADRNKLYHNYLVYGDTALVINSLHAGQKYYFSVEAFNENGISRPGEIVAVE